MRWPGSPFAALLVIAVASAPALAESALIEMSLHRDSFLSAITGGSGVMTYKTRQYRFILERPAKSTSPAITNSKWNGRALNVRKYTDIEGRYSVVGKSESAAGTLWTLRNHNGVVLQIRGDPRQIASPIDLDGLRIRLERRM